MKDFFKEILIYNFEMNKKLIEIFEKNSDKISEKALLLFSHLINAQNLWNRRILSTDLVYGVWEIIPFEILKKMNTENLETSENILENFNLETIINYKNTTGEQFGRPVKDIVFHYCNHSTYHRAQIAKELKTNGINPPATDFIHYKNQI